MPEISSELASPVSVTSSGFLIPNQNVHPEAIWNSPARLLAERHVECNLRRLTAMRLAMAQDAGRGGGEAWAT